MKKLLILFLGILLLASCKKNYYNNEHLEDNHDPKGDHKKINVCHREGNGGSHIINISKNAWSAHQAHGDVRLDDQDGDGYVPTNACGYGQMGDCNDLKASVNPGAAEICGNDIDENCNGQINESCFATVTVCNQIWMAKNLNVSSYRNGDPIPQVTDINTWINLTTGAWCWYNNDSTTYAAIYGKLYNWYAVADPRGLAPLGWHVPTSAEWATLSTCLGGEAIAGGALKEAGTTHWASPNTGATNSSGFTALPAGIRFGVSGLFVSVTKEMCWWSSTESNINDAYIDYLNSTSANNTATNGPKTSGYSVRCVKN